MIPSEQRQHPDKETEKSSAVYRYRSLTTRRALLKQLYDREMIEIENLLRAMGYAFIPTHP